MPEKKLKVEAISPTEPPGNFTPDIHVHPALALPGTTDAAPFRTPTTRWRARLRERLAKASVAGGVAAPLVPYLARAQEMADAYMGEIQETTGSIGPIAATQVTLGAKFAELAAYYLDHADPDTKQGRSDVLLARACADTSRLALGDALKTSAAIAAMRPKENGDPLGAYLDQPQAEEQDDE